MRIKVISIFGIMLMLISILYNNCLADSNVMIDNVDRSDVILNAFAEWMDTFKSEDTPENRRIISYKYGGWGTSESNPEHIKATVNFIVEPVSKENTEWNYSEPVQSKSMGMDINWQKQNICFIEMTNINGVYKVDYIGDKPKDYDKFVESLEQYKEENPDFFKEKIPEIEKVSIKGEEQDNYASNEIQKINDNVIVVFSLLLLVSVIMLGVFFVKGRAK